MSAILYMLTVAFIVMLKRVDSFTNSLNVSRAALKILGRCFSEGYWLIGLIICDKTVPSSQKLLGLLVIINLKHLGGKMFDKTIQDETHKVRMQILALALHCNYFIQLLSNSNFV